MEPARVSSDVPWEEEEEEEERDEGGEEEEERRGTRRTRSLICVENSQGQGADEKIDTGTWIDHLIVGIILFDRVGQQNTGSRMPPWCLLFVLIRQERRGGSGPLRLIRALIFRTPVPALLWLTELNLSLKARPEAHTFDFIGSGPGPVRDFGTERALVEPLGPNTTNFPS